MVTYASTLAVEAYVKGQLGVTEDLSDLPNLKMAIDSLLDLECSFQRPQGMISGIFSDTFTVNEPEPIPSVGFEISHRLPSHNRDVEARFQTDIVQIYGRKPVSNERFPPYTRTFEAIGDWLPNLMITDEEGNIRFAEPRKWLCVRGRSDLEIKARDSPLDRGASRFYLSCGKVVDLEGLPRDRPFIRLPKQDMLCGYEAWGYRADITYPEILEICQIRDQPRSPGEIFKIGARRAKAENRQPEFAAYFMPSREYLGDSPAACSYLESNWGDTVYLCTESSNYSTALQSIVHIIRTNLHTSVQEGRVSEQQAAVWEDFMKSQIPDPLSEEAAERIHKELLSVLANGGDISHSVCLSGHFAVPQSAIPEEFLDTVHFDGKEHEVRVCTNSEYVIPDGLTVIPVGSSGTTTQILSGLPHLPFGLRAMHARFTLFADYMADSIMPRRTSEQRGRILNHSLFWQERMSAKICYEGLWFTTEGPDATETARSYAVAFNTSLVRDFTRRGSKPYALQLGMPCPGAQLPAEPVTPYFDGLGVRGNLLKRSPLLGVHEWKASRAPDLRKQLPEELIELLLHDPVTYRVPDLKLVIQKEAPAILQIHDVEQGTKAFHVTSELLQNLTDSLKQRWGEDPFPCLAPQLKAPTVDPESSYFSDSTALPPEVPPFEVLNIDESQLVFHSSDAPRGTQRMPYLPGDWPALRRFWSREKLEFQRFKELYTAHWLFANRGIEFPCLKYHHPLWGESLADAQQSEWLCNISAPVESERLLAIHDDSTRIPTVAELRAPRPPPPPPPSASYSRKGSTRYRSKGTLERARNRSPPPGGWSSQLTRSVLQRPVSPLTPSSGEKPPWRV